jgi:hypothetical protein
MTEEDKKWAIGGGVVAAGGLLYWYFQKQKAAVTDTASTGTDTTAYLDSATTAVATDSGTSGQDSPSTPATTPVSSARQPDTYRWSVGQEMMAIGSTGTKGYEAKKMANGAYTSNTLLKNTFVYGDKIGKIIWVGTYADGTFRYVIQKDGLIGSLLNDVYWIADYRVIQPIDGSKGIATTKATTATTTSSLNVSLVLKKGVVGPEVKELQKRLGIPATTVGYGTFGPLTETTLKQQKGVTQITLATFATTNPSTLDFNKVLKRGVVGPEVKELQKRLGFKPTIAGYGTFGPQTESALFAMKAVKQTTLNQYSA